MKVRGLRTSEKLLIGFLFLACFGVFNMIKFGSYGKRKKAAEDKIAKWEAEEAGLKASGEDRELWEKRCTWIDEHLPELKDRNQRHAEWLEYLQASAKELDLDIDSVILVKPKGGPHHKEVAVTIQLDGPENQLYRWLAQMQRPELFQAVKYLKLYRDQADDESDEPLNECRVTLAKLYR